MDVLAADGLLLLLLGRGVLSVVVRHVIYPALSWNRDEVDVPLADAGPEGRVICCTTGGNMPGSSSPG